MKRGKATRYPGVFRMGDDSLMIRAKVMDPRTGYQKEVTRKLETMSLPEAARVRVGSQLIWPPDAGFSQNHSPPVG